MWPPAPLRTLPWEDYRHCCLQSKNSHFFKPWCRATQEGRSLSHHWHITWRTSVLICCVKNVVWGVQHSNRNTMKIKQHYSRMNVFLKSRILRIRLVLCYSKRRPWPKCWKSLKKKEKEKKIITRNWYCLKARNILTRSFYNKNRYLWLSRYNVGISFTCQWKALSHIFYNMKADRTQKEVPTIKKEF